MKKTKKKKTHFKLLLFLAGVTGVFVCLYLSSDNILKELAYKNYVSLISEASYSAADVLLGEEYSYKDLFTIEKNDAGDVTMIITDSYKVNKMASVAASKAYSYLNEKSKLGVEVPLGAFTGIGLIGGFGQKIRMKLLSVSSVKCEIVSQFEEAGINQTRHVMYIKIISEVSLVTKLGAKSVNDVISIIAYDNLVIGKIPSVYVDSSVVGNGKCEGE